MIKKKLSNFAKRYQSSYETKDSGGGSRSDVMDWKKVDGEVSFYTPVEGRNRINIVPYEIKSKNHPLVKRGDAEIGEQDYVMDIWVHRNVGPTEANVLCLKNTYGKPCPICEQMALFKKQGKEDEARELKPSRKVYYNVQDMKEPDKLKVFSASHYLFEKELIDEARDDEAGGFVDFADPEDGKEIKFRATEVTKGSMKYKEFKSFSFEDREEPISDELLENAISFDEILNVPTYEEVQNIFYGKDNDEEEEEKPVKKARVVEDDEEDDDDVPVAKPSKRVVEEDEEEDEPVVKPSKRVIEEDEEEEEKLVKASKTTGGCKFGHKFGKDCDKYEDCDNCDCWDKCMKSK